MNKYIRIIFLLLISLTAYLPARAALPDDEVVIGHYAQRNEELQKIGEAAADDYQFKVGDTIIIRKEQKTYLTGENISNWVYYVRHRIAQVGGKRFPNGVLLEGINSWVDPKNDLLLLGSANRSDTALLRVNFDRPFILERLQELEEMTEEDKRKIQQMAEEYNMTTMINEAREQHIRDSIAAVERAKFVRDSISKAAAAQKAREKFVRDSLAREEALALAAKRAREKAIRDSLIAVRNARRDSLQALYASLADKPFSRVGIGLRGGLASMMQKTMPEANGKWKIGFDALLDAQYAYYWRPYNMPVMGIMTGLSIGYARNGVTAQGERTFDFTDEDGDNVRYTITGANAVENDGSLTIEIPAMFTMIIKEHYFVNVGARFAIPVFSHYSQTLTATDIDAWNMTKNVHVPNEIITGKVTDDMLLQKAKTNLSRLNIMLSAEGGYELKIQDTELGIGVYVDYSLFSIYPNDPTGKQLIGIVPPSTESPAVVTVTPVTEAYVKRNGLGFFDAGIKVVYHFKKF